MNVAVIGAGWAGCAAAVSATRRGHRVTLFEATRSAGGRARAVPDHEDGGAPLRLDNGQHILIGAYTETLGLMRLVGADPQQLLLRQSLALVFADGSGLLLSDWPAPLDALAGIAWARGWSLADKLSLLRVALGWRRADFSCDERLSVADLCQSLSRRVCSEMIDPLCLSALNTPPGRASARLFLRVLKDSLFGARGGSNLLLPRVDLGQLFPQPSLAWLQRQGATVQFGRRVAQIACQGEAMLVDGQRFDAVILATPSWDAMRLLQDALDRGSLGAHAAQARDWLEQASCLRHEAITTLYARTEQRMARSGEAMSGATGATLPRTMLAMRSGAGRPAQFVFDRGQLGGPAGLLAFVASASGQVHAELEAQMLAQGQAELGLTDLRAIQTIVEKRATFACTPGLRRPRQAILPGLLACGDYVDGPYPSTLEGAVRSALSAARSLRPWPADSSRQALAPMLDA